MDDGRFSYSYPLGLRILAYPAFGLLCAVALLLGVGTFVMVRTADVWSAVLFAAGCLVVLRFIIYGIPIMTTLRARFLVDQEGIRCVGRKGSRKMIAWSEIEFIRDRSSLQVLELLNRDRKKLLMIDYALTSFTDFREEVRRHSSAQAERPRWT